MRLPRRVALLAAIVLLAGCGEVPTADREPRTLHILPTFFQQGGGLPILPVDEVEVTAWDLEHTIVLGRAVASVAPTANEVAVELEVDPPPGGAVVVEVVLRQGTQPVYVGGPLVVVSTERPVEVPVAYVGAGACNEWAGSVDAGPIGGAPAVARGALEIGDCYRHDEASFVDRWRLDLAADAGLDIALEPVGTDRPLFVRLVGGDGATLHGPVEGGVALPLAAGSYRVEVTSAEPLDLVEYRLSAVEYDRCDVEAGVLVEGVTRSGTLRPVDCPLAGGRVAHLWAAEVTLAGPYRIDLESPRLDMQLLVTAADVTDPFSDETLLEDDDRGAGPFDALVAGLLPAGRYRVWSTIAAAAGSSLPPVQGNYQIAMRRLARGRPGLEIRGVEALETGSGICGNAHAFVFHFGFEDGDGDLVEGGGVTIRLTSIPTGVVEVKRVGWESFPDLNPFAGYATVTTCETFLAGDVAKDAEFFLTDAAGETSATISQRLTPVGAGAAPRDGVVQHPGPVLQPDAAVPPASGRLR